MVLVAMVFGGGEFVGSNGGRGILGLVVVVGLLVVVVVDLVSSGEGGRSCWQRRSW